MYETNVFAFLKNFIPHLVIILHFTKSYEILLTNLPPAPGFFKFSRTVTSLQGFLIIINTTQINLSDHELSYQIS